MYVHLEANCRKHLDASDRALESSNSRHTIADRAETSVYDRKMPVSLRWVLIRVLFSFVAAGVIVLFIARGSEGSSAPVVPVARPSSPSGPELSSPLTRADLEAWLDGLVPYALQQADIAGAVIIVVKDGQILLKKGYGYADVAKRIPMDPVSTVVGVGSVSKLFVWTAVMQLAERGKLDIDRDINAYLDFRVPPRSGKPITLRNLMTHSAGFAERDFRQVPKGTTPRGLEAYLNGTPVPDRIYEPSTVPAYSNYGAMLGGYIVQRVSGEPFADYIERHILGPLNMQHSTFRRPLPADLNGHLSQNYRVASEEPNAPENEEPAGDPSGHLTTTADDISRFMLAHLQQGRYQNVEILYPSTAAVMHALAFKPPPIVNGMTLGFFRMDRNGHQITCHPGDIAGFHADLELLPDDGVGLFLGLNSDGMDLGPLTTSNSLRFSLAQAFMDRYFAPGKMVEPPTTPTAKPHAQLAAGEYWVSQRAGPNFMQAFSLFAEYFSLNIAIRANDDGTITTPGFLSFRTGRPQTWREIGPFTWREVGGDSELDMLVEAGQVKAFAKSDVLAAFDFQRVSPLRSARFNIPVLICAVTILLISALKLPVTFFVRRRYGIEPTPQERLASRLTSIAATIAVVYGIGWIAVLSGISKVGFEPWIRLVQCIGLLCIAGAVTAVWDMCLKLKGRRSWWSKAWSILVTLALVDLVWFSFAFHLISANLNY
jgi:CubicO group peptidase (beta-lactamase class C family)